VTRGSSKGWMNVAPVSFKTSAIRSARPASVGSQVKICAPYPATAAFLTSEAFAGMTMKAGTPRNLAARAKAAAWLPDEWVPTPRLASWSEREKTALQAPRNLKAPTFWKFSHLKYNSALTMRFRLELDSTGVRCTNGSMRRAACRTESKSGKAPTVIPSRWSTVCTRVRSACYHLGESSTSHTTRPGEPGHRLPRPEGWAILQPQYCSLPNHYLPPRREVRHGRRSTYPARGPG